jgi:hypothetical protein
MGALILSTTMIGGFSGQIVHALEGLDGTIYFSETPELVDYESDSYSVELSVVVPQEEEVPLQALIINQEQNPVDLDLNTSQIDVVRGRSYDPEAETIPTQIKSMQVNNRQRIMLVFEEPVEPGTAVSVSMRPAISQELKNRYLFGVSALPEGDQPKEYFLGFARAQFPRTSPSE